MKSKCELFSNPSDCRRVPVKMDHLIKILDEGFRDIVKMTIHVDDFNELVELGCPKDGSKFVEKYNIPHLSVFMDGMGIEKGFPEIELISEFNS